MKERIRYRVIATLALAACSPAVTQAQDPFGDSSAEPNHGGDPFGDEDARVELEVKGDAEQTLRREMAALEAATAQRRKELERRMQQIQMQRRAEEEQRRAHAAGAASSSADSSLPVKRWIIGVQIAPPTSDGVRVQGLVPSMPAARAGIEVNDLIRSVNGIRIKEARNLVAIVNAAGDQALTFQIKRGEDDIEKTLVPAKLDLPRHETRTQSGGIDFVPGGNRQNDPFAWSQATPAQPQAWKRVPDRPRVMELRSNRPANANPDTAELSALKQEIVELRELVRDVAKSLEGAAGGEEAGEEESSEEAGEEASEDD